MRHRTSALSRSVFEVTTLLALGLVVTVPQDAAWAQQPGTRPAAAARSAVPTPGVVTINANDHFYEAPNPIPGGVVTFRLVNKGKDFHHVWIVKIDEGYAFSDFMKALGPGRALPEWATGLGGPESPEPGQESRLTVELPPGRYALACLLPARESGTTHLAKGMFLPLTVTKGPVRKAPTGDVAIRITAREIVAPATVTPGTHLLAVYSEAPQPRGFRLARLQDGKTASDIAAWIAGGATGAAPFELVGGTTPLAQGAAVWMPLRFTAGNYALLPMALDVASGELRYQSTAPALVAVR